MNRSESILSRALLASVNAARANVAGSTLTARHQAAKARRLNRAARHRLVRP